ncbi:MAG: four helix bundle protein [Candidatus Promineifilaceae bacterium]|jgi:four helix bundle protein
MDQEAMKQRTKQFSVNVIGFCESLPDRYTARRIGDQLLRSGTSVGANYRAARRARSRKEFISKLGTVEEEADESLFWMELLVESDIVPRDKLVDLWKEGNEILSIIVATIKSAKSKSKE